MRSGGSAFCRHRLTWIGGRIVGGGGVDWKGRGGVGVRDGVGVAKGPLIEIKPATSFTCFHSLSSRLSHLRGILQSHLLTYLNHPHSQPHSITSHSVGRSLNTTGTRRTTTTSTTRNKRADRAEPGRALYSNMFLLNDTPNLFPQLISFGGGKKDRTIFSLQSFYIKSPPLLQYRLSSIHTTHTQTSLSRYYYLF